jgi:hypothetical protein
MLVQYLESDSWPPGWVIRALLREDSVKSRVGSGIGRMQGVTDCCEGGVLGSDEHVELLSKS